MAGTYDSTVNAFYLAYYGRPADPAGLAYWSQALAQSGGDFGAIVDAFSTSAEAKAHFSSDDANDHIAGVYQQLFGRAPDQAGLDYWATAIKNGSVTLADAAIQIMNGAQSTDAQVSALRQDAAAQFTAQVAASGVAYDGSAAIDAARVLIAAVTPTTSAADIKSLVTAGASLVQTAHDNPAVIAALAKGGDLAGVLATTGGKADPVAVVQAVASIAKAAANDSAGLSTLLKGGSVADLVNSLPAGTTLQDVTKAVDNGGLAAGTVAVKPPAPPVQTAPVESAPVITPKIAFSGADGHDLPLGTTLVANSIWYFVDVPRPTKELPVFQVSDSGKAGTWVNADESDTLADGTHYIRYLIKGTNGVSTASNALKLVMDSTLASPTVQLSHDTGTSSTDGITNDGDVTVSGLRANEVWTYSFDGKTWTTGKADANGVGTIVDTGTDGVRNLTVHTQESVDKGTAFTSTTLHYTVEKYLSVLLYVSGHLAPEVTTNTKGLVFENMVAGDRKGLTMTYEVSATGNQDDFHAWTPDQHLDDGTYYFRASAVDVAGNTTSSAPVTVHLDNTPSITPVVQLEDDTGVKGDGITTDGGFIVSGLDKNGHWEYSSDGVQWYYGPPPGDDGKAIGYVQVEGAQTLQVRAYDNAGNASAIVSLQVTTDYHRPADGLTLASIDVGGQGNGDQASLSHATVVLSYTGTLSSTDTLEYNLNNTADAVWTRIDGSMIDTGAKTITLHDVDLSAGDPYLTVHATSVAGNNLYYQQTIDGPATYYGTVQATSTGLQMVTAQNAQFYLTDSNQHAVALQTTAPGAGAAFDYGVVVGAQSSVVQGVLGAGTTADTQTRHDDYAYGFGTAGNDTITGSHVWGFGGDDTINAVASHDYYGSVIYGGLGADQIHVEATEAELIIDSAQESFVAADDSAAHGFDTVYVNGDFTHTFNFEQVKLVDNVNLVHGTGLTGTESGNALLQLLNTVADGSFKTDAGGAQAALVSLGNQVNFLVVDADGNGKVDTTDYVVKIVGIDATQFSHGIGNGFIAV